MKRQKQWDTAEFRRELVELCRARFPLISVVTHEEDRTLAEIRAVAEKLKKTVAYWSASRGIWTDKPHEISRTTRKLAYSDLAVALEACEEHAKSNEGMLFVLLDPSPYLVDRSANPIYRRKLRDLAIGIRTEGYASNVIIVSPQIGIPYELEKETTVLNFPLPTRQEIRAYVEEFLDRVSKSNLVVVAKEPELVDTLVNASLGLSFTEIKNALAKSIADDRHIDLTDVDQIFQLKQQIVRKNEILEYVDTRGLSLDLVGGLQILKKWLVERSVAFSEAARSFGIAPSKGVLLTGVPGCGKSLAAKCVSAAYGLPLIRLDMGKVYSSLVGSSEERIRMAIQTCEAVAPCILWIDEIEKGLPRSVGWVGDNGVSLRVLGTFLTWLQEKTAPVFVFATANQISLLSPEMMRKGRFDEIFFVDLPHREERREILSIHLNKVGRHAAKFDMEELLRLSGPEALGEGISLTGAEIEAWVQDSLISCFNRKLAGAEGSDLSTDDLKRVAQRIVPIAKLRHDEIAAMRDWANTHALGASDLPRESKQEPGFMIGGRRLDLP